MTVARPSETKHVDAEHSAVAATPSESAVEAPAEHSAVAATPSEGDVEAPASISAPAEAHAKATTTRAPQRCRTCGLVSKEWRQYHMPSLLPVQNGKRVQTRFLPDGDWRYCTIPESQRLPGFPCNEGKKLLYKRKKQCDSNEIEQFLLIIEHWS